MKNYTIVSRMCDDIFRYVSSLKLYATDPTKPSYVRIQAQRRLAYVLKSTASEYERPYHF